MLPLPYSQNKAFGTLAGWLTSIEATLQPVLRKRTVTRRNGRVLDVPVEEEYPVRPKAVSDGCQATLRLLIMLQLRAIDEVRRNPFLLEPATDAAPTPPPVSTNNEELARLRKVSSRAIRDHLKEAEAVGVIVRRVFRGTQANFELWISTKFLWVTDSQVLTAAGGAASTKAAPAATGPAGGTNFPLIEVLEKQVKRDSDSRVVEKLATDPGQASLTGNTGLHQAPEPAPRAPKPLRQAKPATKDSGKLGAAKVPSDAENELLWAQRRDMAREFFGVAWKLRETLWPGQDFAEHEVNLWKTAVWNGVYRGFAAELTETQWTQYHQQALKRLAMVAKYQLKHPASWLVLPFARFVRGTGYFDAENEKGFVGTQEWYARKQAYNFQLSLTRDLGTAKKRLNAHRLGLGTKRDQARTRLQLYHLLETRLRTKYGPEALAQFHAAVAPPAKQAG